ncbi:MAG: D-2-hydroxyacid dehydrogenase [Acidimicrobiaceae bacterium]|nr:D-2-hydroxyacid dehydrogenase [Acidimicrobiaceae bacterium]
MNTPLNILICSYLEDPLVERIRAHPGVEVLNAPELLPLPRYPCEHHGVPRDLDEVARARWREMLASADVCFDFDWEDPARTVERAPRLRWIQATSAGIGQVMTDSGLSARAITVTTTAGIHGTPLAEWVLTGLLHFVKDVPDLQARKAAHRWERTAMKSLAGRRALVVGLGNVGRRIAASLVALGVEVWGAGRPGRTYDVPGLTRVGTTADLGALLEQCDVVVLACPLTAETAGLLGRVELALLPPAAIVVNVSRGQVIDEAALVDALSERRLLGAVLDVAATEPLPADSPLWDLNNVLLSPHSASTVESENAALVELFLDNLDRFLAGTPLRNLFRADLGY